MTFLLKLLTLLYRVIIRSLRFLQLLALQIVPFIYLTYYQKIYLTNNFSRKIVDFIPIKAFTLPSKYQKLLINL